MTALRWIGVYLAALAAGYGAFAPIRLVGDVLFLQPDGSSLSWAIASFLAQLAFGFFAVGAGPFAAPSTGRRDAWLMLSGTLSVLGLIGLALTVVIGTSLGRAIPAMSILGSLLGSATAAFLWSRRTG